jgi:heme exporter protein C
MTRKLAILTYWLFAALAFAGAAALVFAWTPEEKTMGIVQKIFYFHLPVAINTFLACTVVCIGGVGYLAKRQAWWDDLASAAGKVAVVLCTGVLLTGMLWAKGAWGVWWTWSSPRLTFSFMLWLLFVVYLIVRGSVEGRQKRAVVSAVYGLIAYLDIPLVYLSARLIPDIHPGNIALAPSMKLTLGLCFIPITMMAAGLIVLQYQVHRARRAAESPGGEEFRGLEPVIAGGAA